MAGEINERISSVSQRQHDIRQRARGELFLKGPIYFKWLCHHLPDATSRLILIARAFAHIEGQKRIKLTRKHWECAGITDKDTRSRVIAKIRRACPDIRLDAKQGRCTYIEFNHL